MGDKRVTNTLTCPRKHCHIWIVRLFRNPVYGYAVTWVRIPPSPPDMTKGPLAPLSCLGVWWCGRTHSGPTNSSGTTKSSGTILDDGVGPEGANPMEGVSNLDAEGGPERSEGRASGTMRAHPTLPHSHRLHPSSRRRLPICRSVAERRRLSRTSSRTLSQSKRRAIAYRVSPLRTV